MAKNRNNPSATGDGVEAFDGIAEVDEVKENPPSSDPIPTEVAKLHAESLHAEIARLKAENEKLKAVVPARAFVGKYKVSLKDGPAAIVECGPGEHPFEAFKNTTGVISSQNAPEIHAAPADAPLGIVRVG